MEITAWVLLAHLVLPCVVKSTPDGECPFWKDIVKSPQFRRYILATAGTARLDVGLPPEFGADETYLMTNFLKTTPISVRLFNHEYGFCERNSCDKVRHDRRAVLLVFCRSTIWMVHYLGLANPYFFYLTAISADLSDYANANLRVRLTRPFDLRSLKRSGVFNFTVHGHRVLVTESGHPQSSVYEDEHSGTEGTTLVRNSPLGGRHIRTWCLHPYFCDSPKFQVLPEIILERNASFQAIPIKSPAQLTAAIIETHMEPTTLMYFHGFLSMNLLFPSSTVPCHYDALTYFVYVKGLVPMPKEAVLLLPFNLPVWISLLASFAVSVLFGFLVTTCLSNRPVHIRKLAILFGALFLHQSYPIPRAASRSQSFRIILGVWSLMAVAMATAFQGVLVSLLWKVPLEGELPDVLVIAHHGGHKFRVCVLTFPLDQTFGFQKGLNSTFSSYDSCLDESENIQFENEARSVFLVFGLGFPRPERYKEILLERGYVQVANMFPGVVSGPEIRSTSPHRKAVTQLLKGAFEAGIFERAARVEKLRRDVKRGSPPETHGLGQAPMKLSDLRPCFFVLLIGTTLSWCAFAISIFAHRMQPRMVRTNS